MAATAVIGRNEELTAIGAFIDAVAEGPAALVLSGEAGIGKTMLWQAGVAQARARAGCVLTCRGIEGEASLSFAGLSDLLGGVLEEVLPQLVAPRRRALEVALLLVEPGTEASDAHAVGLAVLDVLRALADQGPLLLALDDAQWLDPASDQPKGDLPVAGFPRPLEVPIPPECEGWEEFYSYDMLFSEERRGFDESRFWFHDRLHYAEPFHPFDAVYHRYLIAGFNQGSARLFVVPPSLGLEVRILNGYVYLSGNSVTDEVTLARRAALFATRWLLLRALGATRRALAGEGRSGDPGTGGG
jgi:hypothetical protein